MRKPFAHQYLFSIGIHSCIYIFFTHSSLFSPQLRAERSERRRGLDQEGRQRSVIERTLQLTSEKHEDLKANYNKLSMQVCAAGFAPV
jgi:hypothetical protein